MRGLAIPLEVPSLALAIKRERSTQPALTHLLAAFREPKTQRARPTFLSVTARERPAPPPSRIHSSASTLETKPTASLPVSRAATIHSSARDPARTTPPETATRPLAM